MSFFIIDSKYKFDKDASIFFNMVPVPFSYSRKFIINTLVKSLKETGNWNKLDRLYLLATEAQGQSLISLVNPTSQPATLVNAPAFVADRGYTGNGSTSYINTNFDDTNDAINFTQNSNAAGVYVRTNVSENFFDFGTVDGSTRNLLYSRHSTSGLRGSAIQAADIMVGSTDSRGFNCVVRTASNAVALYKNGNSVQTGNNVATSLTALDMFVCCVNSAGSPSAFSTKQIALFYAGSGTINQAALYTTIQAYMTEIGANV